MRAKHLCAFLVVIGGLFGLFGPVTGAKANEPRGHGKAIAGSYLLISQTFLGPLPALMTLNANGGYTLVTTASAGLGGQTPWASRSPAHGTWELTGPREITGTDLRFDYDSAGNHISTPVITRIIVFDSAFESFVGTMSFEVFMPNQDPLDPGSVPFVTGTGTLQGRRIPARIP